MAQPVKTAARAAESKFRNRQKEQQLETAGMMRWLLTYADMITLMLALFIILFAMSTISRVKVQQFAKLVSAGFDNTWSVNQPPNGGTNESQSFDSTSNIPAVEKQLEQYVQKHQLQKSVQVHMDHRGLVITLLSDKSYYNSGSAELRPQTKKILDDISGFLKKNDNLIRVEGNTDNVPISTPEYPTNWELSTARAVGVVRYLVEHDGLDPTRASAAGYGEFRPRRPNDNDDDRQQNRRVDIVLLNATNPSEEK
ncbi:MAG TPA: flagellar motor protein MotB [Verrucomicrobiae bacterium]|nr:flagellar motor protein MotB [Verrucomicrobiae bacterium]